MESMRPSKYVKVKQPLTFKQRVELSRRCAETLKLTIPCLVDGMDNGVAMAFTAELSRTYVLSGEGRILYRGEPAPLGFDITRLARALADMKK